MSGAPPRTSVDDVEDALLELIFALVCAAPGAQPPRYRHDPSLALVCRRWRHVYSQSTLLWQQVRINWLGLLRQAADGDGQGTLPAPFAAAAAWLSARPQARRLELRECFCLPAQALEQLFPEWLASPRLEEVALLGGCGSFQAELKLLGDCPRLAALSIGCAQAAAGSPHMLHLEGSALSTLGALPALRSLELFVDKIAGSTSGLAASLSGLTRLAVRCRLEAAALAPDLLEGLTQLRRLELNTVRLAQFTPRLAQALARLTHLSCCDVLAAQPRRRAGVQLWEGLRHLAALQELRLESQAGAGMPENALACTALRGLTMLYCAALDWPAAPLRYARNGGCVGSLASLCLASVRLPQPPPPALWAALAPGLTALTWRSVGAASSPEVALAAGVMLAAPPPRELAHLRRLRSLRLEYAGLEGVPAAVQDLPALSLLSLEGNRVQLLPEGPYLTGLTHLNLSNNDLKELPEGLAACRSLEELCLKGNPDLTASPAAVQQLAAGAPRLACIRLSLPLVGGIGAGGCGIVDRLDAAAAKGWADRREAERMAGLRLLAQLFGRRLVLETGNRAPGL